jgi:hypothetical protein
LRDRVAFGGSERLVQDFYDADCTNEFYAKGYQDDEYDRTATYNVFVAGKVPDYLLIENYKDDPLSHLQDPNSERITANLQLYNTKQNLTTHNMQTLLSPQGSCRHGPYR